LLTELQVERGRGIPKVPKPPGHAGGRVNPSFATYELYADGDLFSRFVSNNGRNGHLKTVEAFVLSCFVNKAALMTTNCFGAVTHIMSGGFSFDISIAGHSMF